MISEDKIKLIQKDPRLFGLVYEAHVQEIFKFLYMRCSRREVAEDLTSTTFMHAMEKIEKFSGNGSQLRAWLYTIARNAHIDWYRKEKNKPMQLLFEMDASDVDRTSESAEIKLMIKKLIECIKDMKPPEYVELLVMRYKQELSNEEVATIMGKTHENIRVLFSRAVAKLKEVCKQKKQL
jgi:RNA polymerase sigma-70 factor, ECF subfamily